MVKHEKWEAAKPELPGIKAPRLKAQFCEYADRLISEWFRRQALAKPTRRAESANAWFKREAYRLLKHLIEGGAKHVFQLVVRADNRSTRLVEEALKNPFKLGLLAMFADESGLSKGDRHVFGNQMLYAWSHDVPPEFLNAFLAISGGPALIAKKLKEGFVEPGFEHRHLADRLGPRTE